MSRVKEGTTLAGFRCDATGCSEKAGWSPMLCVPYLGYPVEVRKPIIAMIDTQVCLEHWKAIRLDDIISPRMKDTIEETARINHGVPDFERHYISFVPAHSFEYLQFLQAAGLVYPDDAIVPLNTSH